MYSRVNKSCIFIRKCIALRVAEYRNKLLIAKYSIYILYVDLIQVNGKVASDFSVGKFT